MCGRIDQNENARQYLNAIGWTDAALHSTAAPRFNVPPGTYRPVLHVQDGVQRMDDVWWSYRSAWAATAEPGPGGRKIGIAINAKLEKLESKYWLPLLRKGRGIVCASGWFEWTGPKGARQAWHMHRKDREPLFFLAVANFGAFKHAREEAGFVLVTWDAAQGMEDIHDRRPLAVSAEDARRWMDPALPAD